MYSNINLRAIQQLKENRVLRFRFKDVSDAIYDFELDYEKTKDQIREEFMFDDESKVDLTLFTQPPDVELFLREHTNENLALMIIRDFENAEEELKLGSSGIRYFDNLDDVIDTYDKYWLLFNFCDYGSWIKSANERKKVYIAGPEVFLPSEIRRAVEQDIKYYANKYGLEAVTPMDTKIELTGEKWVDARAIYNANIQLIDECDAVLANITPFRGKTADSGTVFEIGYAAAKGKVISAYTLDDRTYFDRLKTEHHATFKVSEDKVTWLPVCKQFHIVEDFDMQDNLMIDAAIKQSCGSILIASPDIRDFEDFDNAPVFNRGLYEQAIKDLSARLKIIQEVNGGTNE